MKPKIGKLFNSIKNSGLTCCLNNSPKVNTADVLNGKKRFSCKDQLRLIYYTLFHNESNNLLTVIETLLYPLIECFNVFMRFIGWVKYN